MSLDKMRNAALYLFCLIPALLAVSRGGAEVAMAIISLLFILKSIITRDWQWLKKPEIMLMLAMVAYLALNTLFNSYAMQTLRALGWGRFIIFYAATCYWLLSSRHELSRVTYWGIFTCVAIMIDTYWQYVTGISLSGKEYPHENRLGGSLSTPNVGNLLLKVSLPLIGMLLFMAMEQHNRRRIAYAALYGVSLVVLILVSGERSIAVLMTLALATLGVFSVWQRPTHGKEIILALMLLAVVYLGVIATQSVAYDRMALLLAQINNFPDSSYGQLFTTAIRLWKDNILFGSGMGEFKLLCNMNKDAFNISYCDIHPHNIYLQWLVDAGLIGLLMFVAAMGAVIVKLWRSLSFNANNIFPALFSVAALVVLLWPVIITQNIFSNWPAMLFWYSLSLAVCAPRIAIHKP